MTTLARDQTATMYALHDPQVGDRFHEMYSFWVYVLAVTPTHVTIISASSPCTFPADGKVETLTRDAFVERFSYGTIPGAWVSLRNRGSNVEGWLPEPAPAIVDDRDRLQREKEFLLGTAAHLSATLQIMVDRCPFCAGTGINPVRIGEVIVGCFYCAMARHELQKIEPKKGE